VIRAIFPSSLLMFFPSRRRLFFVITAVGPAVRW
jgi:hypothetical protein